MNENQDRISRRRAFEAAMHSLQSGDAPAAASACRAALADSPDDPDLLTLLGVALLAQRLPREALEPLRNAARHAPRFARAHENLGQALLMTGQAQDAVKHLQQAARLDPSSDTARIRLAHALATLGQGEEADAVYEQAFGLAPDRRRLAEAAEFLRDGKVAECGRICRELLARNADDVNALRLLAKAAGDDGRWPRAERLLRRALVLAPDFLDARVDLARVLKQLDRYEEAIACAAEAVERSPRNAYARYMLASMLAVAGRHEEALAAYRRAIELRSFHPAAWIGMGHLLKTLGRTEEGIAAYRKAIEQRPNFGEAYWSLANLKTFRFLPEEIAAMERQIAAEPLDEDARVHFLFTLGKACEDGAEFDRAFAYYASACALQRGRISYDPVETALVNERIRAVFTSEFLHSRAGQGYPDPAPIFIVGLPRSGSTLIEQILASHSRVEGTAELPDVGRITASLARRFGSEVYPEAVRHLDASGWNALGEEYIARTRRHRSGRPRFTDKMPNNFPSIGLIHLMLPNARIIDARRHPLDSCFGSFKQHFAHGQAFSYDLLEIGEYFLEYRAMMRHWATVLPGCVLEVRYENLVRDLEGETRRLLEFCTLPFEASCLEFHATERAVRTASSEQVRQPIYSSAVNRWQDYREHLGPLREILAQEIEEWERPER